MSSNDFETTSASAKGYISLDSPLVDRVGLTQFNAFNGWGEGRTSSLEVAAVLPASRVNGPGLRAVIWLQGCDLRCKGCINTDFLEIRPGRTVRVDVLAEWIFGLEGIEGVTLSGGEPTLQAEELVILCRVLRERGFSIVSYSGHLYEELVQRSRSEPSLEELLSLVDLLIDGPYDRNLAPGGLWRGSANQRLVPLTDRYTEICNELNVKAPERVAEIHVTGDSATWTGIFPPSLARTVATRTGKPEDPTIREANQLDPPSNIPERLDPC